MYGGEPVGGIVEGGAVGWYDTNKKYSSFEKEVISFIDLNIEVTANI